MFKVQIDAVNKSAQFKLNTSLAGFSLDITGNRPGQPSGKMNLKQLTNDMKVRAELIRVNQPNVILYDMGVEDLAKVLEIMYQGGVSSAVPVSLEKNLVLSDDAYILVSLDWDTLDITKIDVFENRVIGETDTPISIKDYDVDENREVNTEFYDLVVFGSDIKSLETVRTDVGDDGIAVSQKQELSFDYLRLLSKSEGAVFHTAENQKVKFFGSGKVYLVNVA